MIAALLESMYGFRFVTWHGPDFSVHPCCFPALVLRHSFHGKGFPVKRMGQQTLERFHFPPSAFLCCLDDTHLEPTHTLVSGIPINGIPFILPMGNRTSIRSCLSRCVCCHLLCFLLGLSNFLVLKDQMDVGPLSRRMMLSSDAILICPITGQPSLFPSSCTRRSIGLPCS